MNAEDRYLVTICTFVQVFNLGLAYAITFLASNVPYVTFELIIALDQQDNMGPIMAALFGILPTLNSALNPFMYLMFNSQLFCMQVSLSILKFLDRKS